MRRPTAVLLLCLCSSLAAATTAAVNGVWLGKIQIDGEDYRIVLRIGLQADGSSAPTLDIPDAGKLGISLPSLKADDSSVAFELNDPRISFKGSLSADHAALVGDWKQDDQEIRVTLARITQRPEFEKDGSYLFHWRCASCHTAFNVTRAPWPNTLADGAESYSGECMRKVAGHIEHSVVEWLGC